ncbi:heavy-metal-associated domain-containing protein [Mesobacillus maritimus]|uniref:heavy-metal-associated domain-containing protein n=1 Tax=Mesobacillus maritimus TaxID=1643336 RepID=UPI002040BC04|nr:heavy metal-associated domain-containing protein [Mesobacillus maritimus]MCM3587578.1 heavy-metal-associated domain-containing protein [Mesobacillus maritimus]MCM3672002.1 heavy-metal-associated domain-containing protein [Mesobacillus maritimus]
MEKGMMKLDGMRSQEDADKVLHALNEVWGVREAEVNVHSQEALFSFDEKAASLQDFEQAVRDCGYNVIKQ